LQESDTRLLKEVGYLVVIKSGADFLFSSSQTQQRPFFGYPTPNN